MDIDAPRQSGFNTITMAYNDVFAHLQEKEEASETLDEVVVETLDAARRKPYVCHVPEASRD